MPSWLITGANRGIGFSTVEALLKNSSNFVIATSRDPSAPSLVSLANKYQDTLKIVQLDVESPESIERAVKEVTPLLPSGLDYLVNNAGKNLQPGVKFEDLDLVLFADEINFNTVVPLRVSRAFLPLIKKSQAKKIIFVSSVLASSHITSLMVNQLNAYSVGKAALNMLAKKWGASLRYEGITTAAIHPGWTQTDLSDSIEEWMTKYAAHVPRLTREDAGAGLVKISEALTVDNTGLFWHFDGTNLPW